LSVPPPTAGDEQATTALAGVPAELHTPLQHFKTFYNNKYNGRRLQWLFNLSSGIRPHAHARAHTCAAEVRLNYCDKPYMVSMSVHQLAVVQCLQERDECSTTLLLHETQMPVDLLQRAIRSLADAQLIIVDGEVVRLNMKFTNKRTKFKIIMPISQHKATDKVSPRV
jgi:hypothetical protein